MSFFNRDFDKIKAGIKSFISAKNEFTDYDFEGSNLSTIIDTLAYNTYITSYNANMVSNEVFFDSATLRENVISLARNIGYVPRSRKSARAVISFFVDTSNFTNQPVTLTLKKGIICNTSPFGSQSYSFTIPEDITVSVADNIAQFNDITVYEGVRVTQNFTIDPFNPKQRFILENSGIDTSLINVTVKPNNYSTVTREYKLADSLFDINSESAIYFIQEIENERYELIFGDDAYTGFFEGHQEPDNKFWGVIQFWGYCMIIVAILQLLKALSVENL